MKNMRKNRLYQITRGNTIVENMESENTGLECKPRLLLHSCCGPCSTSVIEKLMENFDITILYYNPNITEQRAYLRRKINQIKAIEFINQISRDKVKMIDDEYCTETYFEYIKGYEDCEEGGARCSKCFSLRLYETARIAKEEKFHIFGTTLTVSPHKSYLKISTIGKNISKKTGVLYLDGNFKKLDGYRRSVELSNKMGLYRQNYCGCEFSKWMDKS